MRYGKIEYADTQNGPGIRVTVFVSGCRINCPGCFNKTAQNFKFGEYFTQETVLKIVDAVDNEYISGLSILGGEPFDLKNINEVRSLVSQFRNRFGNKTLYIWTGYTLEQLQERFCPSTKYLLSEIDVLIDGPFVEELKDVSLKWRGSSNQRVLQRGKHF